MARVLAEFLARGPDVSKYDPNVTGHGKMYHEIETLTTNWKET